MSSVSDRLFMLVLIIMTVCETTDFDPFSLTCENVTGSVGEVLTLSCDVSWHRSDCCIALYKFQYAVDDSDFVICRKGFPFICEQTTKLTCSYSSDEELKANVTFFVQLTCGHDAAKFTVEIREAVKFKHSNDDHNEDKTNSNRDKTNSNEETPNEEGYKSKIAVIIAAVSSIVVITIIIMVVIRNRMKYNSTNRSELQMDYRGVSVSQT